MRMRIDQAWNEPAADGIDVFRSMPLQSRTILRRQGDSGDPVATLSSESREPEGVLRLLLFCRSYIGEAPLGCIDRRRVVRLSEALCRVLGKGNAMIIGLLASTPYLSTAREQD